MIARNFFVAAVLFSTAATAHAFLESASPSAGAALSTSPKEIRLQFSETLEAGLSGMVLKAANGTPVETPKATIQGKLLRIAPLSLAPGNYHVDWHVVSVDTHRTEGSYNFRVGP